MKAIVDLNAEVLIDRSRIQDLRLLLTATGQELAKGSAWVAVDKKIANQYGIRSQWMRPAIRFAAAKPVIENE